MPEKPNTPAGGPKNYTIPVAESQEEICTKSHKNKYPDLYTLIIDTGQSICYNTVRKNEGR